MSVTEIFSKQKALELVDTKNEYPIDALPKIIRNAVTSYQSYGQQPLSMIACSALASVSLVCQALANVARDKLLISPTSLYFLVVADSGERKSASDSVFRQAINEWELKTRKKLAPLVQESKTQTEAWRAEKEGLLSQIRRNALLDEDSEDLKKRYNKLVSQKPKQIFAPSLFFEDATSEALAYQLATGWPNASLSSDEGGIVVSGNGVQSNPTKFVAMLNRLWDGKDFTTHRKTSDNFTVKNARLSLSLMMQPAILEQLLNKSNGISRNSGFLARSLIAYPASAMGSRMYVAPPKTLKSIQGFNKNIKACLDESLRLEHNNKLIPTINISPKAKNIWVKFFNQVESSLSATGSLHTIRDFASKAPENVARLSALFHLFEGKTGDISVESMEKAISVISWHLQEVKCVLSNEIKTLAERDVEKLTIWLKDKGIAETSIRHLLQYSPIRDRGRLEITITKLIKEESLTEKLKGKKTILLVN